MNAPTPITPDSQAAGNDWGYYDGKDARTADGLVVKNVSKIAEINTRVAARQIFRFYAWQVGREVRRDFHLLSNKFAKRGRDREYAAGLAAMFSALSLEAELLKDEAKAFPAVQLSEPAEVDLRVVNAHAAILIKTFSDVDVAIALVDAAGRSGEISREQRDNIIQPFFRAYNDLKSYALGKIKVSDKTAAELGEEQGLT